MPQAPNKTANRSLFAWADIASAAVSIGTPLDVSTLFEMAVAIRFGRRTGSAFTAGWPNIRIEGSVKSSGDNSWSPLFSYQPPIGASIVNTTLNGAVSAAASTFVVTSATNIAVGDLIFLGDTTASNYEVVRIKAVSGTTITPEDAIVNGHANAAIVTDQADIVGGIVNLGSYQRVRAVVDNSGSGQAISVEVLAGTLDSVG
jgi:hypothetical protein